jgi:myo-inositol 2-dehydrogenase/D-chiro-inositol 1-dehydrogenase
MGKTWNVAVIGAGDMGAQHVKGWKLAGHNVLSITDLDTPRAEELAQKNDVKHVFKDYKEAITQPGVEIISICLPLALHAPITIFAAEHGKHVFSEKPLARNFQEVAAMEEAVRKAGVQFGLGFQRNYSNAIWEAKKYLENGTLGRPVVAHSDSIAMIRPKRVMHDANGNMGPIMDLGCHYFIMWQTLFGSLPKTVYASGHVLAKDREELAHIQKLAVDTGVITINYESGDTAVFTVTWGMPPQFKLKANTDRIYGPKGGIQGGLNNNGKKFSLFVEDQVSEVEVEGFPSLHAREFEVFVEALEAGKPAPVSFQQGREVLALTLAIFKSIETGQVIDFKSFYDQLAAQ